VGDSVVLWAGQQTCDLQVVCLSPGWTPLCSGLWQATYTCVPLPPSSIIWYRPKGVISLAGKVAMPRAWWKVMAAPTTGFMTKSPVG